MPDAELAKLLSLWLLNPVVIQVGTRGNADSVIVLVTLLLLFFCMKRMPLYGGFCLGFAAHLKLYPVIYSLPLFIYWNWNYKCRVRRQVKLFIY